MTQLSHCTEIKSVSFANNKVVYSAKVPARFKLFIFTTKYVLLANNFTFTDRNYFVRLLSAYFVFSLIASIIEKLSMKCSCMKSLMRFLLHDAIQFFAD